MGGSEHFAWDCSSVPSRVASLLHQWMHHKGEGEEWVAAIMRSLVKVPAVALMLPCPATTEMEKALRRLADSGIELLASAETSLWDSKRTLYVLRLRQATSSVPVAQLQSLLQEVSEATLRMKPSVGPWLWPLHEPEVSAALLVCDAIDEYQHWVMRIICHFRILAPAHLEKLHGHIREQYSALTTFVFAWSESYVRGIWVLLLLALPTAMALNHRTYILGWDNWQFYFLQALVLLWTLVLAGLSSSRWHFAKDGWESQMLEEKQRRNPDHWHSEHPKSWAVLSLLVTVFASSLCLCLACFFLFVVMEMKMLLIFNWGDCFRLGCIGPEQKHGFVGWLTMVATDILLALLIIVATGELYKAFAFHIAKFWNFKDMRNRLVFHIVGALIDGLTGVGVFCFLAFAFLPEWVQTPSTSWDDVSMCQNFFDYKVCRAMAGCAATDTMCCSGTFFCAGSKAPFSQRKQLFDAWLGGLFMVSPFVDVLVQFVVPLLAYYIHLKADRINDEERDSEVKRRSCCCGFLEGLGRLVCFIFLLDGGVMGLPYVWRGYPFKTPALQFQADDEMARKVIGPDCESCKQDMHWETFDTEWSCRLCLRQSREPRWHCKQCQQSLCRACHPLGTSLNHLFGPLDQRLLRPFNPIDELKLLKMNFIIVVMFAPVSPWGLIAQLFVRLLDVHSRLSKLLTVRRRDWDLDRALAYISQKVFRHMVVPLGLIWHIGLAMISYNTDLYKYQHSVLLAIWFSSAFALALLAWAIQRLAFKGLHARVA